MPKNNKKQKKPFLRPWKEKGEQFKYPLLTSRLKRWIAAILMFVVSIVIILSFFQKAGNGGKQIFKTLNYLIGKTVFFIPSLFAFGGVLFLKPQKKRIFLPIFGGIIIIILGICGILTIQDFQERGGGIAGYLISWPFFRFFGSIVSLVIFFALILVGGLILWEFSPKGVIFKKKEEEKGFLNNQKQKDVSKLGPEKKSRFDIKILEIPKKKKEEDFYKEGKVSDFTPIDFEKYIKEKYKTPPFDFLDSKEEKAASGDINYNSQIIKKTLQNFGIEVEMAEVNVGPTVTQHTLKPAEGVKISKIVSLNNDLALALASHPIRIEAPIPGRSLVGIEVPNKIRASVKIGNLISLEQFQKLSALSFPLGKDVMGEPIFSDLSRMPHLLVAGSTGSGKTICLNSIILSLIFRNSPRVLRMVLVDPKRVEFPVYASLPHLLSPVIYDAQKTINILKWLIGEMERRFGVLKEAGARDIVSFNKIIQERKKSQDKEAEYLPYIILVIDELADLMAAKGREVEGGIVRLSQLSRAVGIHLIVATQRPSVEVITGLIKANITSRIAFQVASQVDSRTILDMAGAEKLLGRGDMLFLTSEFSKPKRIQGSIVTTGEIKKVVEFIARENAFEGQEDLEKILEEGLPKAGNLGIEWGGLEEEPLYDEAKRVVIEYHRASASLLQRRLKIGYARAARILDMLEEKGVIGQGEGAKPREVFLSGEGISRNDEIINGRNIVSEEEEENENSEEEI